MCTVHKPKDCKLSGPLNESKKEIKDHNNVENKWKLENALLALQADDDSTGNQQNVA